MSLSLNLNVIVGFILNLGFSVLFSLRADAQALLPHKGLSFQAVIKTATGQKLNATAASIKAQILTGSSDCVLREETHTNIKIQDGYFSLVIGGPTAIIGGGYNPSPLLSLVQIFDNSQTFSGLTCVNADNSINLTGQSFVPNSSSRRKLRLRMTVPGEAQVIVADFNFRAVGYALSSESLNGKRDTDFLTINNAQNVTQANIESLFLQFTKLNTILSGANTNGSIPVQNLALDGAGTPFLNNDGNTFLSGDGTWKTVAGGGGAVTSVAGRTGAVVLASADITDATASNTASKLVLRDPSGNFAAGAITATSLGANSVTATGAIAGGSLSATTTITGATVTGTTVSGGTGQFTNLKVYDGTANYLTQTAPVGGFGGAGYTIQWPTTAGTANQVLQINSVAGDVATLGWVTPSIPTSSQWKDGPSDSIHYIAGNVGIGTATPNSLFSVGASNAFQSDDQGNVSLYSGYLGGMTMYSGIAGYKLLQLNAPNGQGGRIRFASGQSTATFDTALFRSAANALTIDDNAGGAASLDVTGDTHLATVSGNVGIGTTTPAYPLDMSGGTIRLFSSNINKASFITGSAPSSGNLNLKTTNNGNTAEILLDSDNFVNIKFNGSEKFRVSNTGNVGIGTTTPMRKLDVGDGTVNTSMGLNSLTDSWYYMNKAGVDRFAFGYRSSTDSFHISSANPGFTDVFTVQRTTGNLGVGTTTPSEKIDVNGAIKLGSTTNTNAGTIRWDGIHFQGYNGSDWVNFVPNPATSGSCDSTVTYSVAGTYSYTVPASFGTITIQMWGGGGGGGGAAYVTSPGGGGGTTSIASLGLTAFGGTGGSGINAGAFGTGGAGGGASGGTINTNGSSGSTASGSSSGAGGTAPNGGAGGPPRSTGTPGALGSSPGGGGSGGSFNGNLSYAGGGGSGGYLSKTFTSAILNPSSILSGIVVGGGGGGGTATSGSYGGMGGAGQVTITCVTAGAPPINDRAVLFSDAGQYSTSSDFVYTAAGNVGIGTATPGSPLDVRGAIRLSDGIGGYTGFQPAASAGSTVWTLPTADGANGQVLTTNGSGGLLWSNPSSGIQWNPGAGSSINYTAGNVGIGNSTAPTKLTVDNGNTLYGALKSGNAITIWASSQNGTEGRFGVIDNNNFAIQSTNYNDSIGHNLLLNPYGGNVGIGSTSPGYKLDVAGSIKTSSTLFIHTPQNGGVNRIRFSDTGNGWDAGSITATKLGYSVNSGLINISTAGVSNQLFLDSTGNVGIGTNTPAYTLDVAGDVNVTGNFKVNGTNLTTGSGTVNSGIANQMAYYSATGAAVSGNASATISSGALTLGQAGSVLGSLNLSGNTSGVVSINPQAAAGTYNFNLPTTAGTAGQPLLSAGGGASPMTWSTVSLSGGNVTVPAAGGITNASGEMTVSANTNLTLASNTGGITTVGNTNTTSTTVINGGGVGGGITLAPGTLGIGVSGWTTAGVVTNSASGVLSSTASLPISLGGTNNSSLGVTNGGVLYTDGTKVMNMGVGTSGQVLQSNGAAAPGWVNTQWNNGASNSINYMGGNVGIGTTTPRAGLDVNSTILGKAATSNAGSTIDFSTGNLQYTTNSCGAFQFNNVKDGGSYVFAVKGTTAATCSFTAYSDAGVTALTVHMPPDHGATIATKHTLYNLLVLGPDVYISWTPNY